MMQTLEATFGKARVSLQEFGRSWANYSIALGKNALETGAGRLKATATFLEDLSERLTQAELKAEAVTDAETATVVGEAPEKTDTPDEN